jgi:hypothetical protein
LSFLMSRRVKSTRRDAREPRIPGDPRRQTTERRGFEKHVACLNRLPPCTSCPTRPTPPHALGQAARLARQSTCSSGSTFATRPRFALRYATNVSAGGMFIRTREPKPVGTRLDFKVELANGARC